MKNRGKPKSTPARRRPSTPKPTAALMKVAHRPTLLAGPRPDPDLPVVANLGNALSEDVSLGALGLVEVRLTEQEEAILGEPVNAMLVQIKPTGQVYYPHQEYTRWFNRAFGRLGWSIAPRAKPAIQRNERGEKGATISVVCPYILYIHGKPAAFAMGEHEYHENNADQTYGDALEATVASALRRCAKRLGVGSELWDRAFGEQWRNAHAVKVRVRGARGPQWRRKDTPPAWNEEGVWTDGPAVGEDRSRAAAGHDGGGSAPITEKQRGRLRAIARNAGRSNTEVRMWLKARYGWDGSEAITREKYDEICAAVAGSGALPLPADDREPGEEG